MAARESVVATLIEKDLSHSAMPKMLPQLWYACEHSTFQSVPRHCSQSALSSKLRFSAYNHSAQRSNIMASIRFDSGPRTGERVPLDKNKVTFGRAKLSDCVLSHPTVSREHFI